MPSTFSTADKTVPKKRDQSKRRAGYQPKFSKHGRPGKRTPQLEKDLLAAIETGAPYRVACLACGISDDAFTEWRRKDPEFAARVNTAAGKTALRLLKKIEARAEDNFSAAAWMLERRFPDSFSRPEVQVGIQNNVMMSGNNGVNGISLEQIVVSDLEFLGLAKKGGYQHRPVEREAREVEAEIVPENLSGTLFCSSHPDGAVISESQAAENERRMAKVRKEIEERLAAKLGRSAETEELESVEPEAPNPLTAGTITLPTGLASASWWRQFCEGDIS